MTTKLIFNDKIASLKKKFFYEGGTRLRKRNTINKSPLFSIITVVYNNEKYLEETILSVLKQSYKNFEYIIVDGGSTDRTLEIIKKYNNKIDYWVSEKDKGIYDAFNKGMSLCRGNFIGIINSDDTYTKNSLKIISSYIKKKPVFDFIFGSVRKHWGILHGYKPNKIFYSWGFYSSHSTGFFIKRSSAQKVGLYDLKYKYHADYDYFYRLIVQKKMTGLATKKKEITGIFRRGGFSSTINYRKLFKEEMLIRYNNKQNFVLLIVIFIYKIVKHFKKIVKS
jgi:glycosyltransferase involved in cell wall biosynthesis